MCQSLTWTDWYLLNLFIKLDIVVSSVGGQWISTENDPLRLASSVGSTKEAEKVDIENNGKNYYFIKLQKSIVYNLVENNCLQAIRDYD